MTNQAENEYITEADNPELSFEERLQPRNTQTGKIKEMIKLWISININEVIDNLDKELENKCTAFYTISDICTLDRQEAWDGEEILEQYVPNHIKVLTGMYPYYYYFLAKRQNS